MDYKQQFEDEGRAEMVEKTKEGRWSFPAVIDNTRVVLEARDLESGGLWGGNDYGMWVGRDFYPTTDDYIKEAEKMGCCKKVPGIPEGIEIGDSRIFLVHKDAGRGKKAVVFGYFKLDGIVACTKLQAMIETTKKSLTGAVEFPVTALTATERVNIPLRGCGEIDPPSFYFVGPDDITMQKGFRKPDVCYVKSKTRIVVLPEISIDFLDRFRGLKRADKLFEFANLPQ